MGYREELVVEEPEEAKKEEVIEVDKKKRKAKIEVEILEKEEPIKIQEEDVEKIEKAVETKKPEKVEMQTKIVEQPVAPEEKVIQKNQRKASIKQEVIEVAAVEPEQPKIQEVEEPKAKKATIKETTEVKPHEKPKEIKTSPDVQEPSKAKILDKGEAELQIDESQTKLDDPLPQPQKGQKEGEEYDEEMEALLNRVNQQRTALKDILNNEGDKRIEGEVFLKNKQGRDSSLNNTSIKIVNHNVLFPLLLF